MADGSVIFETGLDTGGLSRALSGIGSVAKGAGKTFSAGFKGVGIALGAVTTGLGFLAKTAVTYNNRMEQYTTNFGVMLGDEAAAVEHVAELREMAAKTPFGMSELADASQTMLSFGMDAETTKVAMQQLGDISLGNKERFGQLSLAFAQVSAAGKLTGQDLLQMVNAGFNPLQTIAEKTGTNLGDLKDVMAGKKGSKEFRKQLKAAQKEVKKMGDNASEGAKMLVQLGKDGYISAEMIGKAMEIETSPGGRFYDGMQKASETFSGMVSTLQDDATNLIGKVFEPLTDSMKTNMLPLAQKYIGALETAFDESGTEGLATALGTVLGDAITKVSNALPDVLTLASNLLSSVATGLTDNADKIANGIHNAIVTVSESDLLVETIGALKELGTSLLSSMWSAAKTAGPKILADIYEGLTGDEEGSEKIKKYFVDLFGNLESAATNAGAMVVDIVEGLKSLEEWFTVNAPVINGILFGLAGALLLVNAPLALIGIAAVAIAANWEGLKNAITAAYEAITKWFDAVWTDKVTPILEGIKGAWDGIVTSVQKAIDKIKEFFGLGLETGSENKEAFAAENERLLQQYQIAGLMYGDPSSAQLYGEKIQPPEIVLPDEGFDLFEWLIPDAGAEGIAEQAAEIANETVAEMDKALLAAFQNGEISYDELVAARFGEGLNGEGGAIQTIAEESVTNLSDGIQQNGENVNASVAVVLSAAKSAADTSQFSSVGAQIAGGIARGISNGTSVVAAAARRLVQSALKAAEAAADIHSPSRLFASRIGEPIAAGTAVGVSNGSYLLRRAVTDMVNTSIPDMRGVASGIMARGSAGYGGTAIAAAGGGFNQTNNFNVPVQTPDEFSKTMRLYATYGF